VEKKATLYYEEMLQKLAHPAWYVTGCSSSHWWINFNVFFLLSLFKDVDEFQTCMKFMMNWYKFRVSVFSLYVDELSQINFK
jgi:hypothetical protein